MKMYVFGPETYGALYHVMAQSPEAAITALQEHLLRKISSDSEMADLHRADYLLWKDATPTNLPPVYQGSEERYIMQAFYENQVSESEIC